MKKLLLFFLTAAVMVLSGGVTGEYAFELTIDETMQDLSGNGNHPVTQMPVSSWINDGMEALRFSISFYVEGAGVCRKFVAKGRQNELPCGLALQACGMGGSNQKNHLPKDR